MINGEIIIEKGEFVKLDEAEFTRKQNKISKRLIC